MLKIVGVSILCIAMTGCLFVVESRENAGTAQWYQSDVDRVVAGETDAQWIKDAFGEPARISRYDDGSEIWRYRNTSSSKSEVGLFLLFNVDVERDREDVLALEIRDGIVSDYWIEER